MSKSIRENILGSAIYDGLIRWGGPSVITAISFCNKWIHNAPFLAVLAVLFFLYVLSWILIYIVMKYAAYHQTNDNGRKGLLLPSGYSASQNKFLSKKQIITLSITGIVSLICLVLIVIFNPASARTQPPESPAAQPAAPHEYENILGETTAYYDIQATNPNWQATVTLTNGEQAIVTVPLRYATNGAWITDSTRGDTGAGGYLNTNAGKLFEFPDAPEGSLLMRFGNGTHYTWWTNAAETKTVVLSTFCHQQWKKRVVILFLIIEEGLFIPITLNTHS